jgi:hypothetical protein
MKILIAADRHARPGRPRHARRRALPAAAASAARSALAWPAQIMAAAGLRRLAEARENARTYNWLRSMPRWADDQPAVPDPVDVLLATLAPLPAPPPLSPPRAVSNVARGYWRPAAIDAAPVTWQRDAIRRKIGSPALSGAKIPQMLAQGMTGDEAFAAAWRPANPGLGRTVPAAAIRAALATDAPVATTTAAPVPAAAPAPEAGLGHLDRAWADDTGSFRAVARDVIQEMVPRPGEAPRG